MDHGRKSYINVKKLRSRMHEVNPGETRVVINKNNIISVTALGNKRCGTPYIGMNQIKRTLRPRLTRLIREV